MRIIQLLPQLKVGGVERGTVDLSDHLVKLGHDSAVISAGGLLVDLLNEHELGHALGFAHIEEEGHIMHPIYGKMGKNFWIP